MRAANDYPKVQRPRGYFFKDILFLDPLSDGHGNKFSEQKERQ